MLQRRELLTSGMLFAAGGLIGGPAAAQQHDMKGMAGMGDKAMSMTDCIGLCSDSHRMCLETADYAVKQGGVVGSPSMIAMLTDCAELCQATANSMLRASPLHQILCRACAEACDHCAQICARQGSDARLARCAKTCRSCAEGCGAMGAPAN